MATKDETANLESTQFDTPQSDQGAPGPSTSGSNSRTGTLDAVDVGNVPDKPETEAIAWDAAETTDPAVDAYPEIDDTEIGAVAVVLSEDDDEVQDTEAVALDEDTDIYTEELTDLEAYLEVADDELDDAIDEALHEESNTPALHPATITPTPQSGQQIPAADSTGVSPRLTDRRTEPRYVPKEALRAVFRHPGQRTPVVGIVRNLSYTGAHIQAPPYARPGLHYGDPVSLMLSEAPEGATELADGMKLTGRVVRVDSSGQAYNVHVTLDRISSSQRKRIADYVLRLADFDLY